MRRRREACALAGLLLLAAAGCGARERRWPFPPAASTEDAGVIATLRERTLGIGALYAELTMSFDSKERSGVASAVVHYKAPGRIRMTAFKDILVSSRGVFDFLLTPERYTLAMDGEKGPERHDGPAADLEPLHPGFRAMGALREAMFLPGLLPATPPPAIERAGGRILVRTAAPSGREVEWSLDPRDLGVREARVRFPGGGPPAVIRYESYRLAGGYFFPEEFRLDDPDAGVSLGGVLDDLEVEPEIEDHLFDPADIGR